MYRLLGSPSPLNVGHLQKGKGGIFALDMASLVLSPAAALNDMYHE